MPLTRKWRVGEEGGGRERDENWGSLSGLATSHHFPEKETENSSTALLDLTMQLYSCKHAVVNS
jgi:hypothetical protein